MFMCKNRLILLRLNSKVWILMPQKVLITLVERLGRLRFYLISFVILFVIANERKNMTDLNDDKTKQLPELSEELMELYARLVKLQKQRVRITAEIDNVRELIRQKG